MWWHVCDFNRHALPHGASSGIFEVTSDLHFYNYEQGASDRQTLRYATVI
jgi:hypothetical protein